MWYSSLIVLGQLSCGRQVHLCGCWPSGISHASPQLPPSHRHKRKTQLHGSQSGLMVGSLLLLICCGCCYTCRHPRRRKSPYLTKGTSRPICDCAIVSAASVNCTFHAPGPRLLQVSPALWQISHPACCCLHHSHAPSSCRSVADCSSYGGGSSSQSESRNSCSTSRSSRLSSSTVVMSP